jgi:antitoxin component YwqK of YwqJK toxin-antitoxin module
MKKLISIIPFFFVCSCSTQTSNKISQEYFHKYGLPISHKEWIDRDQDGLIVTQFKNGITLTESYTKGDLDGPTDITYAHSNISQLKIHYNKGNVATLTHFDSKGVPVREEQKETPHKKKITLWDEWGVPLSIETYENNKLVQGTYFTDTHDVDSVVENGYGIRIKRNRQGHLLSKDRMEHGDLVERTTFHPNGEIQMIASYRDYKLHGEIIEYTPNGSLFQISSWTEGKLSGLKTTFKDGQRMRETAYRNGIKEGFERTFDKFGNIRFEIPFQEGKRHGKMLDYSYTPPREIWYYKGKQVSNERFTSLNQRDQTYHVKRRFF